MSVSRLAAFSLAVAACAAVTADAQVKVGVRAEYDSVLVCENMNVFVTIQNDTGAPIVINPDGGSNIDLRFIVTRDDDKDKHVPSSHDRPLIARMMARDGETYEGMVDIAHAFDVGGEGRYTVLAEVVWRGRTYRSAAVIVDVVKGLEIESVESVLKGYEDLVRRYSLRYWNRDRFEHLFLSVQRTDTGEYLGVFDLGTMVRVFKPVVMAESSGDVLVVHQSGPERFTRTAFRSTLAGVVFVDQVYLREDGTMFDAKRTLPETKRPQQKPAEKRSWWSRLWSSDAPKQKAQPAPAQVKSDPATGTK